ncbi:MAG TPA: condensation domain-containing protein, partial [Herpetosiphonaceae bacterium]
LRGFRIELGEIAAALRQHAAVRDAVVLLREDAPGQARLVAYVVAAPGNTGTQEHNAAQRAPAPTGGSAEAGGAGRHADLRAYLQARLPNHLIPAAFVVLDALPLTPNGKLDRHALPAPGTDRRSAGTDFVAPRTEAEKTLAQIWAAVLRVERVGIHDNFFALGGDSILTIQIIARANQAGLRLSPKHLFQHQTIAQLAAVAGTTAQVIAEQQPMTGAVPLTPIQRWFFSLDLPEPHHFNQATLFQVRQPLDLTLLDQAVAHLLDHHDALRLRFVRDMQGWQQQIVAPERARDGAVVTAIDLSAVSAAEQSEAIYAAATEIQAGLNLTDGPLLRVACIELGAAQPARLLIAIHHLAVDAVSWPILLADLQTAYTQLRQGAAVALPPKTTSFKYWAERLTGYAHSEMLREELDHWMQVAHRIVPRLPVDMPDGANTQALAHHVGWTLPADETHALLHEVPRVYHTQINDVLLAALALAWADWTGARALRLDLEGHGREALFDEVDLSRTVGWFTSVFPVLLDLGTAHEPGAALKTIKEQLRQIPQRGIGYGVLRYLGDDEIRAALAALPSAEIAFNYLGQLDPPLADDDLLMPAPEQPGETISGHSRRMHLLEVSGFVAVGQLHMRWSYSRAIHHQATIERLAERYGAALQTIIAHCRSSASGGYTPSDFPLARLDQPTLDRVVGRDRQIVDIYPLSPMQQGMLFHSVYEGRSGIYVEQMVCRIEGALNLAAFQRAWATVVERHPIFRTGFVWEGLDAPLQIVRQRAEVPWQIEDWRQLSADEQQTRLAALLVDDRRRGFALSEAPLLRLALFRVGGAQHDFVWTHHHLLLDGWSLPLVLNEVFHCYERLAHGQEPQLAHPQPYRDYIAWLLRQDMARAEAFWRQLLHGFSAPTPLGVDRQGAGDGQATLEMRLSEATTAALQALAREHSLTINTLVQGAWAVLLSRYSGDSDIVYGVTVAGRPPELIGVEQMIGLFINTLPVRVQVDPQAALLPWLRQMQALQVELRQFEYSPLVQIQGWSDVPRGLPLFESIVVFENYPVSDAVQAQDQRSSLTIGNVQGIEQSNYPLGITAMVEQELVLRINYDRSRFDPDTIARLGGHLELLLSGMAANPDRRLADLPLLTAAERALLLSWNPPATDTPPLRCLHHLVAAQAARTPHACAVVC